MKSTVYSISAILLSLASLSNGVMFPTSPAGDTVWKVGTSVDITWDDRGGAPHIKDMKPFTVDLYTGSNISQLKLAVIATNVTADTTSLKYTVPDVVPYGKLYFLRFTSPNPKEPKDPYIYWSTRFTITNTDDASPSVSVIATGHLRHPTLSLTASDSDKASAATSSSHIHVKHSSTEHHKSTASVTTTSTSESASSTSTSIATSKKSDAPPTTKSTHSTTSVSTTKTTPVSSTSLSKKTPTISPSTSAISSFSTSTSSVPSAIHSPSVSSGSLGPAIVPQSEKNDHKNSGASLAPAWTIVLGIASFFFM
ncbi:hypothetical protein K7432_006438 [Basidiobolus ranarum]|uniref:Yeast cell wall synthesis Kre9/Knh1-like N-terminal domain-containing protein n=1 Tax=Basidiobolus ranarum TaxID=34480 RepID=A0ABR2W1N6_9FUNG